MSIDPTPAYRPIAYVIEWDNDPLAPALQVHASELNPQVQLCWQTSPNRFYQLWCSHALDHNEWAPLNTNWVRGDGAWHCDTDDVLPGSPFKFYRLLVTNGPPNLPGR